MSSRLKYLLLCAVRERSRRRFSSSQSVVVSHRPKYTQHFHSFFDSSPSSPDQNIVILSGSGWSGLEQAMRDLLRPGSSRAQLIARNARQDFTKCVDGRASAPTLAGSCRRPRRLAIGDARSRRTLSSSTPTSSLWTGRTQCALAKRSIALIVQ